MARQRIFLDWRRPVVDGVAEHLLRLGGDDVVDLSGVLVVVPTRHAGRRLRLALAGACAARERALLSPQVRVPAGLFERPPDVAGDVLCLGVWTAILGTLSIDEFPGLFPDGVASTDHRWALRTAPMFRRLQRELADGGLRIAAVPNALREDDEVDRWRELAVLETLVDERLAELGRRDPQAVEIEQATVAPIPDGVHHVVVAAVPDPTQLLPLALDRLAGELSVDVLVHAPAALQDHFDDWGRPLPEYWTACELPIDEPVACATPQEESRQVLALLAARAEGPGNVAIGVPDSDVAALLKMDLRDHGIEAWEPAGRPLRDHPLFTLLTGLQAVATEQSAVAVADLFRHPDILAWLHDVHGVPSGKLLADLDRLREHRLPATLADLVAAGRRDSDVVRQAAEVLVELLGAWVGGDFAAATQQLLATVYADRYLEPSRLADRDFAEAARQLQRVLAELEGAELGRLALPNAVQFELLLDSLRDIRYYPEQEDAQLDLEGWLELPWNDAPLLIVTGMNDGAVPGGRVQDAFLPDSLRRRLHLRDDQRRLARDSFLVAGMVESRRETGHVVFLCGRTSSSGDPLKPSRLLFRCPDGVLPARARELLGPLPASATSPPPEPSFLLSPPAPATPAIEQLHVTSFRSYLQCPFRFYLQRVLGLETVRETATHMDAAVFGSLLHQVLEGLFTDPELRDCGRPEDLPDLLHARLHNLVRARLGSNLSLPVQLQLKSAEERLRAAARVEAGLREAGWETRHIEYEVAIEIAGMPVRGRIDRVDYHPGLDRWRVLDYKTSGKAKDARAEHLVKSTDPRWEFVNNVSGYRWQNLQLPLYALILREAGFTPLEVGYFNLPKAVSDSGLSLWSEDLPLAAARECAEGIVGLIRAGVFWPPGKVNPEWDDFNEMLLGDPYLSVGNFAGAVPC